MFVFDGDAKCCWPLERQHCCQCFYHLYHGLLELRLLAWQVFLGQSLGHQPFGLIYWLAASDCYRHEALHGTEPHFQRKARLQARWHD